jgi:HSP20 family protein
MCKWRKHKRNDDNNNNNDDTEKSWDGLIRTVHEYASKPVRDFHAAMNRNRRTCNVELVNHEDKLEIIAEVPGVKREDLKIDIDDDQAMIKTLCFTVERKYQNQPLPHNRMSQKDYSYYSEMAYGKFQRCFSLPSNIKEDEIKAQLDHGLLTIEIPKTNEPMIISPPSKRFDRK